MQTYANARRCRIYKGDQSGHGVCLSIRSRSSVLAARKIAHACSCRSSAASDILSAVASMFSSRIQSMSKTIYPNCTSFFPIPMDTIARFVFSSLASTREENGGNDCRGCRGKNGVSCSQRLANSSCPSRCMAFTYRRPIRVTPEGSTILVNWRQTRISSSLTVGHPGYGLR